jgi:hypothetical protein
MNPIALYVFPVYDLKYNDQARRFVETYRAYNAGHEHQLWVICNGGEPNDEQRAIFKGIPCLFVPRGNEGWDIGAYQETAHSIVDSGLKCDFIVCFGTSAYIKCNDWMKRMVESFVKRGDTLFGTMGNAGDAAVKVEPHIRTTSFWISPSLFAQYPFVVTDSNKRYEFEHGPTCLTTWIRNLGKTPYMVTRDGEYERQEWDFIPNGFHRGDQSNLLAGDRVSAPPYWAIA